MPSPGYRQWLGDLKARLRQVQLKAAVALNTELLQFYWELGADIVARQAEQSWGSGFLDKLSKDLTQEFPGRKGFSKRNLEQIRRWVQLLVHPTGDCEAGCFAIACHSLVAQRGHHYQMPEPRRSPLLPAANPSTRLEPCRSNH